MSEKNKSFCQMLSTALEMEKKGKAFFDKAVSKCQAQQCKDIFKMLAKEEVVHMVRIKKIYDSLSSNQGWVDWRDFEVEQDLGKLMKQLVQEHGKNIRAETSDIEALNIGIDLEEKSITYYSNHLDKSTDPLEKEFLQKLVEEERGHHLALIDMKFYLTDPSGWFREMERGGLDGG